MEIRTVVDIYQFIFNSDKVSAAFGLKCNLSQPYRCKNMQEVSNLLFIAQQLHEGQNEVYFRYRKDVNAYFVYVDPNPNKDTLVVALAKFRELEDTRAVDPLKVG